MVLKIEIICNEAYRIDEISSKLLFLASLENRQESIKKEMINLSKLTLAIIKKQNIALNEYNIVTIIQPDIMIDGDKVLLEMAINNLIVNAMKYSIEKEIKINVCENYFCVTNTCDNLNENELELIWTHFYKTDKSRTKSKNSVGLGLPIVKTICDLHGFRCESTLENNIVSFFVFIT
jgi:signal transduction histidine kinase